MKSTQKYEETCVYTGRRVGMKKALQRFEKKDGTEMFFSGVKGVWIGYTYECGKENISVRPEKLDVERIDNAEWEAADALVDAKNAKKRAEAKIAKKSKPALKTALLALAPLCKGLDFFQRKSLIEYLSVQTKEKTK